ncbi:hypothetical protein BGW38_003436, partial [Lunasporangiospora selenospora]
PNQNASQERCHGEPESSTAQVPISASTLRESVLATPRQYNPDEAYRLVSRFEAHYCKWLTFDTFKEHFITRYHTHVIMAKAGVEARSYRQRTDQTVEEVVVDMNHI